MFGTVIKNTLLFLLIILILHFLINNQLIEVKLNKNGKEKKEEMNKETEKKDLDRPQPERVVTIQPNNVKDLYDFVFEEDANEDLNKYYEVESDITKNNKKDPEIKCSEELGGNKNFCNTSKPTKDELKAHYGNFNKIQCEGELDQDKHVYLVNKFKNESPMNGASDNNDGIVGFDGFDTTFDSF